MFSLAYRNEGATTLDHSWTVIHCTPLRHSNSLQFLFSFIPRPHSWPPPRPSCGQRYCRINSVKLVMYPISWASLGGYADIYYLVIWRNNQQRKKKFGSRPLYSTLVSRNSYKEYSVALSSPIKHSDITTKPQAQCTNNTGIYTSDWLCKSCLSLWPPWYTLQQYRPYRTIQWKL